MLDPFPGACIEKERFEVRWDSKDWEIDIFHGLNEGLVVAELEFSSIEDAKEFQQLPPWIGQEITGIPRYINSNLEKRPYSTWSSGQLL